VPEPEIKHGMVVAEHLGGYCPGGDPATFYPALWEYLVTDLGVQSVIDVGCGDGVAVKFFELLGVGVLGVDGVPQEHPSIIEHDYTLEPFIPSISDEEADDFDLCWSCEFVEHVEERYVDNFLATFACAPLVLITHAEPGQAGWHHVNCQHAGYWIDRMAGIGYELDGALTNKSRELARVNEHALNHYARSGLAFHRRESDGGA